MLSSMSRLKMLFGLHVATLYTVAFAALSAYGQDAKDAGTYDADAATEIRANDRLAGEIRSLIAGKLDVTVDPQSLFDVSLDDERALRIESIRLHALLSTVEAGKRAMGFRGIPRGTNSKESDGATLQAEIESLEPGEWAAHMALDRTRLEFYSLPRERREEVLRDHAARVRTSLPPETPEHRRAREVEEERQSALAAARNARSEAERLVREEEARLIGLEGSVAAVRRQFRVQRDELAAMHDIVLGWKRRVRDAKAAGAAESDSVYDALRRTLFVSRNELDVALDRLGSSLSAVPSLGPDPLSDIPPDIPTDAARRRRLLVLHQIETAQVEERSLGDLRASELQDRINLLNHERLSLIAHLSPDKQASITGFTAAGFDQARAEARQLRLVVRYHHHVATAWFQSLHHRQYLGFTTVWRLIVGAIPWLLAVVAFVWWRQRSPMLVALAEIRIAQSDQNQQRITASWLLRFIRLMAAVRPQIEWLSCLGVAWWLLPVNARGLLEVKLLTVVIGWILGGAFIVNAINALATASNAPGSQLAKDVSSLRLRSLRLVGRVIIVFALILLLTARLVGEGTVYRWVLSTCWFAAIPVFLVLVRWWRETVFTRLQNIRRKSPVQVWVLSNRVGWRSFFAAMVGAVQLFGYLSLKIGSNWLTGFTIARRAHAYVFKRTLDRLASENPSRNSRPLAADAFECLAPDRAGANWFQCPADELFASLRQLVSDGRGGLVALIGGRGAGKSSILRRLGAEVPDSLELVCDGNTSAFALGSAFNAPSQKHETDRKSVLVPSLVLLDDAQAIVRPRMGGLQKFDEMLTFARTHSHSTLWVFAIDRVTWPFLQRARDARPLFDRALTLRPWTDEQIGVLLSQRSAEASLTPIFDDLLEESSPTVDEIDKQEAVLSKRAGYFRMIWDHTRGNPGIALQVWRASLEQDAKGSVRVRPLKVPDSSELDHHADATLFILRAVLQMGPTTPGEVAQATRLTEERVQDTFHYGRDHGYFVESEAGFSVSWVWLRSIVLILERRHLLVNS